MITWSNGWTLIRRILSLGVLWAMIACLASFFGCSSGKTEEQKAKPAVPVMMAEVVQKAAPVQVRAIGTVEAYSTVLVKAQVNGVLNRVYFKEGQDVRRGELLFSIDSRPFEADLKRAEANLAKYLAQVEQAKANLARNQALLKKAEADATRQDNLIKEGIASQEQYDLARANLDALNAGVQADKFAIENAEAAARADQATIENMKIQLGYCSIRSPMDGRTGSLIVNQGNLVKGNDSQALVNITQVNPIYVSFSVPQKDLSEIKRFMAMGKLKVEAKLSNDQGSTEEGSVSFVDNSIDSTTGTIRLKGTFANKEKRLWPGQFVQVVLQLMIQPNAIVVPVQAVQSGQKGQYVFVVKGDLTVEPRPVMVNRTLNGESIIEKGLQPGEKVVTDGQLRLFPGAKVEVKNSLEEKKERRT